MKNRKCALFVFDGYADWEPALAIASLNQYSDFAIQTFSISGEPIVSMGGVKINPLANLNDLEITDIDLLLLPGGESWEKGSNQQIAPLIRSVLESRKTVAAICAATTQLARLGLLDHSPHTSNGLEYLKQQVPGYRGEEFYEHIPCVSANGIITANGAGMIEFAFEIFNAFQIMDIETLQSVKTLYKSGGILNRMYT